MSTASLPPKRRSQGDAIQNDGSPPPRNRGWVQDNSFLSFNSYCCSLGAPAPIFSRLISYIS